MPQFAKQFNVIEEHYVIFYAKFVIDDQVGLRCGEPPAMNNQNARYNRNIGAQKRFD